MQHAEAHERLSDLALEPSRLARLEIDGSPDAAALRAHVAACATCTADLAGWRRTWADAGAAFVDKAPLDEIRAPESLRARTLAAVHAEAATAATTAADSVAQGPDPAGTVRGRSVPARISGSADPAQAPVRLPTQAAVNRLRSARRLPWLAAAAAVVVALLGASFGLARDAEVTRLRAETAELETVAATFDRVLAAQRHWTVTLRTADGTAAGTLAWSSAEVVMVATGLPAPGPGQVYRCWVEQGGTRAPMGSLAFATTAGYWAGPMEGWGTGPWLPGTRFGVSLVPASGTPTPVLIGTY